MVHCAAVNCNNNTYKKDQNTGVLFCRLPKDKTSKEKWLIKLKSCDLEVTLIFCYFLLILMY